MPVILLQWTEKNYERQLAYLDETYWVLLCICFVGIGAEITKSKISNFRQLSHLQRIFSAGNSFTQNPEKFGPLLFAHLTDQCGSFHEALNIVEHVFAKT